MLSFRVFFFIGIIISTNLHIILTQIVILNLFWIIENVPTLYESFVACKQAKNNAYVFLQYLYDGIAG